MAPNEKPVPDRDTWLIISFGPPEFTRVTACVLLLPTAMLPKLMLEGLTTSCPVPAAACKLKARKIAKTKVHNPRWIPLRPEPDSFMGTTFLPRMRAVGD